MCNVLLMVACLGTPPLPPDEALEVAIATIDNQERTLVGWRLTYATRVKASSLGAEGKSHTQNGSWKETRRGDLYRTRISIKTDNGQSGVNDTTENGFDGLSYRQYTHEAKRGSVGSANGVDHSYLVYVYGSTQALSDVLRSVASEGRVSWVQVAGKRFLECVRSDPNGAVRTMLLDPEQSWQPHRIKIDQEVPPGTYSDGRKKEMQVIEIKKVIEQNGITVPSQVAITMDAVSATGQKARLQERELVVSAVEINPRILDSEFTIVFPQGTRVYDVDRDVVFFEGQPGSERSVNTRPADAPGQSVMASSGANWFWWADSRIWIGLCVMIGVAIGFGHLKRGRAVRY